MIHNTLLSRLIVLSDKNIEVPFPSMKYEEQL